MEQELPVVIVGGGLAGIMAARILMERGIHHVIVLEKSRSVGGRMATRRIEAGIVDHGAQFFTVRTNELQSYVDEWLENGWVKRWFGESYARYTSVAGMNQLAKQLAKHMPVRLNAKVAHMEQTADTYTVVLEDGERILARGVIITSPAPQACEMLEKGNVNVSEHYTKLKNISFHPCFVALLTLGEPSRIPAPGHTDVHLPDGIERVVDHEKKGISSQATVSIYMTGAWSKEHYEREDEEVLSDILQLAGAFFDEDTVQVKQLKRWRYAEAASVVHAPFLSVAPGLLVAGDAFLHENDAAGRTRFESAFLSGMAAGEEMTGWLKTSLI